MSGVDTRRGKIERFYNRSRQKWSRHFAWNGLWIVGKTGTGRSYYPSAANEFAPSSPDALIPHSSGVISGRIIEQISRPGKFISQELLHLIPQIRGFFKIDIHRFALFSSHEFLEQQGVNLRIHGNLMTLGLGQLRFDFRAQEEIH